MEGASGTLVCNDKWRRRSVGREAKMVCLYFSRNIQLEVWVAECFPHCYTLRWVKCKKPLNQMEELSIDDICWW
jgi:hypothetical protein